MKFIMAPDSFKGSLSASDAAATMAAAFREVFPDSVILQAPMADGGEGTLLALVAATAGTTVAVEVTGPLGQTVTTRYGVLGDGKTAVVEVANIAGLTMVPHADRDPERTTTFGIGQAIRAALNAGYRRLIVGLGGSATNDGGIGMLHALGAEFLDEHGRPVEPVASELSRVCSVDMTTVDPAVWVCEIRIASDVTNPLCGPQGTSAVFGPQKGASPEQVRRLDAGLSHYAEKVESAVRRLGRAPGADVGAGAGASADGGAGAEASVDSGVRVSACEASLRDLPGAGAAGGLGFALLALGGEIQSGARLVAEAIGLEQMMIGADWVITGEGQSDAQTLAGKVPCHVAALARKHGVRTLLLSGSLGDGCDALHDHFVSLHSIVRAPVPLSEAMANAQSLLYDSAKNVARLMRAT